MTREIKFIFLAISLLIFSGAKAQKDEVFQTRISSLKSNIELNYSTEVKKYIDEILTNPDQLKDLIVRSRYFFPILEKSLKSKGAPSDLKYLAVAASLLNPSAENENGASGLWMMAYPITKMYKLKVNSYVDERRDPLKSTQIVSQHFKDLYSIYKSWPLAISAYACSPVTLNKCIRAANNSFYYWDVFPFLPNNCRDLYPKVIAYAYLINFYKEHNIKLSPSDVSLETDSIIIQKWLSFQQISASLDVSVEDLRKLNPSFKKDIIPFTVEGYTIRLPLGKGKNYYLLQDSLKPLNPSDIPPSTIQQVPSCNTSDTSVLSKNTTEKQKLSGAEPFNKKRISYVIKKGDNLNDIADIFDVPLKDIKSWNKLKSNNLKFGQKLIIWVPASKSGFYGRINKMTPSQKKKLKNKD